MKLIDVTALGELLIDFTHNGTSPQGNPLFEANPGGAPCNLLALLSRLGHKTAFIGKVGDDSFGHRLAQVAESVGIDVQALRFDPEVGTTLAFVHTFENGDRDFSFYRNPGADMCLRVDELPLETLKHSRIFHYGTLSMTHEGVRAATYKAIDLAREAGALLSFDPNLRPPLWASLDMAREQIAYGLARCDILKSADNELVFMTETDDFAEGVRRLRAAYPNIRLFQLTAGAEGSYSFYEDLAVFEPAFRLAETIETTGAGDTFGASVLHFVLAHGLENWRESELRQMLRFANAAAALVTTKKGALRVMPQLEEIEALVATRN